MNDLILIHQMLANKEINEGYESIVQSLKNIISTIDQKLTNGISKLYKLLTTENIILDETLKYATRTETIKRLNKVRNDYLNVVNKEKLNISRLSKRLVPVIPGFTGKLSDLSKVLVKYLDKAEKASKDIEELSTYLNKFLLTGDSKVFNLLNLKEKEKIIENVNTDMIKLFDTNMLTDERPLKDLVNNINEIKALAVQAITYGKVYNLENLENIYKAYSNANNIIRNIIDMLEKNKDKLDEKTKESLVRVIKIYAEYLTTITMLYYYYYQFSEMLIAVMKVFIYKDDKNLVENMKDKTLLLYKNITSKVKEVLNVKS